MTQWRTPGEPLPPAASDTGTDTTRDRSRHPLRRQWLVLGIAGAFIVAAIVLLAVVLAGGNGTNGGAVRPGTADAVTDKLASAVQSGSAGQVRAVSCAGAQRRVVSAARPVFGTSATRQGTAHVQGAVAVGQIGLTGTAATQSATVGLRRVGNQWCVASFVAGG